MYQRIMNEIDADILAEELKERGTNQAVINRLKELVTMLDRNYGLRRGTADMGGYILFFEDIKDYQKYFERIISFYHLDKDLYEYAEIIKNSNQTAMGWHEVLYLLSSDDALVFIYPYDTDEN